MAGKQADIKVGVVTNYDDKGLQQAEKGLGNFKSKIAEAEGAGSKLKAGWAGVKDSVSANAGALGIAAGGALVAFGLKAVGAFTDTAKAAIDMGAATGLSVEDSSRWIAVADDMGISADTLQGSLGKVSKTLDDTKWAEYGIETRDAGGEARGTNDILLDTFDMLGNISNETERARVGNDLFGKGYGNLAPLIGKTRAEMEKYLGEVEKGQVITDQEAAKAEKYRLAEDSLKDALNEVTLAVGGVVAELSPMIEQTAGAITKFTEWATKAQELTQKIGGLTTVLELGGPTGALGVYHAALAATADTITVDSIPTVDALKQSIKDMNLSTEEAADWTNAWYEAHTDASPAVAETERETRKLGGTMGFVVDETKKATYQIDTFATKVSEADLAYQGLTGRLDEDEAWENVNTAIADFNVKTDESGNAIIRTAEETRNLTRDIADYVAHTDTIPAELKTEILASLDRGELDAAEMLLANLTRTREIYLKLTGPGAVTAAGYEGGISGKRAAGGPVSAGKAYIVGEEGEETFVPDSSGTILPTAQPTRGIGWDSDYSMNAEQSGPGIGHEPPPSWSDLPSRGIGYDTGVGGSYNITLVMPVIASQADYYRAGQIIKASLAEYDRRRGY